VCREGEEFDEAHSSYCMVLARMEGGPRSESYYSAKLQLVHIVQVTSKVWSPLALVVVERAATTLRQMGQTSLALQAPSTSPS